MAVWIIAILVVLIVIFYISAYNGLQKAKVNTEEAWSQISVQLKRRNDLIPNLVETVKGYAKHEKETLSKVVELRNQLTQLPADDHEGAMQLSNQITDSLKTIFALSESYPDLKANQNFQDLQHQLEGTENRINVARQRYNEAVQSFNAVIRGFPGRLINERLLHLERKEYFKATGQVHEAPAVTF